VAAGWIAIAKDLTLEEMQATSVFEAIGAWAQQKFSRIRLWKRFVCCDNNFRTSPI